MDYLPIFLRVQDRLAVVIGGGAVASRKAELLLKCGARVRLVAPELATGRRHCALHSASDKCHCACLNGPTSRVGTWSRLLQQIGMRSMAVSAAGARGLPRQRG